MKSRFAGIDYGSKMAGTTVIAAMETQSVVFAASQKGQDADQFIQDWAQDWKPTELFLDAPLSLPGVYTKLEGKHNYFYRAADQALQAMSPMFLGGLTARAMRLQATLAQGHIKTYEVYPGALARRLKWNEKGYKKKGDALAMLQALAQQEHLTLPSIDKVNWHMVDAFLALLIGWRYQRGLAQAYGELPEGLIWV